MVEFPPNLDDGELWLPSDIFLNEVPSKRGLHLRLEHLSSCMDDFAQRLAALSLLRQRNLSKPNRLAPVRPVHVPLSVRCGFQNPSLQGYGCTKFCGCKFVPKPAYGGSELFYEYPLNKPVQPQVDDVIMETRARVLQKQENRLRNRLLPPPPPPSSSSFNGTSGFGFGGFVRVSSTGTGVFHPQVSNTTSTNIAPSSTSSTAFLKKKQVSKNRQEILQVPPQRNNPITSLGGVKKEFHYQLPPDMGLPKDWTY